jgi:OmpA-OmpF porin, OOP family
MKEEAYLSTFRRQGALRVKACRLALVILLLSLLGTPALAQIRPGSFSASPFVGGFLFDGNQDLRHRPVFGARLGYDFTGHWGAEALLDYVPGRYAATDSYTDVYNYRVEGLYHFLPGGKLVPFLAAGAGGMSINSKDNAVQKDLPVLDYGAGVKYFLTDRIALRADVRHVLAFGPPYNNLEYTLGVVFYFGGTGAAARTAQETGPAPAPATPVSALPESIRLTATPMSDSRIDLAWNAPSGAAEYKVTRDGSPLTTTTATSVSDAGLTASTRYCYRVSAFDGAHRELATSNEACATTKALAPKPSAAAMAAPGAESHVLEDIHFDFDQYELRPDARAILKRHAAWMMENQDAILTIVVEGHCDERGTAEYNMALGQRRANAAAKYLIDLGVDAKRISTISYGFERPLDPGHNEEAWAKNRRAHFVVTDRGGPKK